MLKEEPNQTFALGWKQAVPGAEFSHVVTTTGETEYSLDVLLRVFCHAIINYVPPKGLLALSDTLKDFYEFYCNEPAFPSAPSLPVAQSVPAKLGRVYTMQPFEVLEE